MKPHRKKGRYNPLILIVLLLSTTSDCKDKNKVDCDLFAKKVGKQCQVAILMYVFGARGAQVVQIKKDPKIQRFFSTGIKCVCKRSIETAEQHKAIAACLRIEDCSQFAVCFRAAAIRFNWLR